MENGTTNKNPRATKYEAKGYKLFTKDEENEMKAILAARNPAEFGIDAPYWTRTSVRALILKKYGINAALSSVTNYMRQWCIIMERANALKSRPRNIRIKQEELDQEPGKRLDGRLQGRKEQSLRRKGIVIFNENGFTYSAIAQFMGCSAQYVSHVCAKWNKGGADREKILSGDGRKGRGGGRGGSGGRKTNE
jgi:transposase